MDILDLVLHWHSTTSEPGTSICGPISLQPSIGGTITMRGMIGGELTIQPQVEGEVKLNCC